MADKSSVSHDPRDATALQVACDASGSLGARGGSTRAPEERHASVLDKIARRAGSAPRLLPRERSGTVPTVAVILMMSPGLAPLHPRHAQGTNEPPVGDRASQATPSDHPLSYVKEVSDLPSKIALAPDDEPGERMIISGAVYEADGVTPVEGAILYLYHTDARGVYSDEQCNNGCPRLRGYLKTDAGGRYEFRSIKPGHYPHIRAPAHIHVHVWAPNQPEDTPNFLFYDDHLVSDEGRARTDEMPEGYGLIKLTPDADGVLRGVRNIKPPDPAQAAPTPQAVPSNPQLEEELRKIMLDITDDLQRGGTTGVYGRYARDAIRAEKFTYVDEATGAQRMIPVIPIHPLEKRTTELVDLWARQHGEMVVFSYRQLDRIELQGQQFTESSRKTVVFLRKDENWQLVACQSSPAGFERVVAAIDPTTLDAYAGAYQNPLWGRVQITREGNVLVFTSANGYRTEYLPESDTEFFEKDDESRSRSLQTLSFVRNDKGRVTHYVVRKNDGQNIVVNKVK